MPILYESVFNIDGRTENNVCSRIELADIRPDTWQGLLKSWKRLMKL